MASSNTETPRAPAACFLTTHWSVVLMAGSSDTPLAQAALEKLCRAYWYPLYAYVRRRGHTVEDAQDLTQEFFARVLEHQWLDRRQLVLLRALSVRTLDLQSRCGR